MRWFGSPDSTNQHRYVEDRLSAYLDGELSTQERSNVETHLATCADCQGQLTSLRQTIQWTSELPQVPLPRAFTIPAPAQPVAASRRSWNLVPVLQGATALIALLLVFAVAGEALLTGFAPDRAPETAVFGEKAVQATQAVSAAGEAVAKEVSVEEVLVEVETVREAEALEAPAAPEAAASAAEEPLAAPSPSVMDEVPKEAVAEEGAARVQAPEPTQMSTISAALPPVGGAEDVEPDAALAPELEAAGEAEAPTASVLPTPTLLPIATVAPTLVARVEGLEAAAPDEGSPQVESERLVWPPMLRTAQFALGAGFIFLAMATMVAMLQRRRAQ